MDNLRTSLTNLVIFHHAAVAYGGVGGLGIRSPYHPHGSSIILTASNVVNQTFFMAQFFLLSGYYSSIAAKKRSRTAFAIEKTKRLAVPTLVYSLFAKGICWGIVAWRKGEGWSGVKTAFWDHVLKTRGASGPTWFTALLFVFDAVYAIEWPGHFAARSTSTSLHLSGSESKHTIENGTKGAQGEEPQPQILKTSHVIIGLSLTSLSAYIIRLRHPFGHIFVPLNLTLGYLPQYILYYAAGIWIQRRGIALAQPVSRNAVKVVGAATLALGIFGSIKARQVIDGGGSMSDVFSAAAGGCNVFAALYAALNESVGFLLGTLALYAFHHVGVLGRRWTVVGRDVAGASYAAFLVHIPVLVETVTAFDEDGWRENSALIKALVVGGITAVKSWAIGWGMKRGLEWVGVRGYL